MAETILILWENYRQNYGAKSASEDAGYRVKENTTTINELSFETICLFKKYLKVIMQHVKRSQGGWELSRLTKGLVKLKIVIISSDVFLG
jgi:tetrahydromethanopterin S-methyltransferase subunit E